MRRVLLILAGAMAIGACASTAPVLSPAQAAEMNSIRAACAALGLNPSEAPFVYCVKSLEASAPTRPHTKVTDTARAGASGAYVDGPEQACASIGLDPATARYSYCVGNLRATLDQADNIGAR